MTMWPMRATIGRPALRCVCKRRRASMIDRRHFLIGAGALLTASFVRRASAFSKKRGRPLIVPAAQEPEETLYANWRVSLGPDRPFAPPPPTWRERLRSLGHPLETDDEIERACRKYDLPVNDLDTRLNGFGWEDRWDNFAGPQAKAFHLLKGLDLGHSGSALRQAGQIIFEEFGGSPGNSYTWVELHDDLTVSLLQARLIELNLPSGAIVHDGGCERSTWTGPNPR